MKIFIAAMGCALLLFFGSPYSLQAQKQDDIAKYLSGAVTLKNGYVEFEKSYNVPGKSQADIYSLLKDYIQENLVDGPESLKQSRIVKADSANFTVVADIEEWLYFKRKAWVTHRTRFYYQIIAQAEDGRFNIIMRRIHYLYDDEERPGLAEPYHAEEWITDDVALNKNKTKLTRIAGKFRQHTIDRKDEIFLGAARAVGAVKKVTKVIEVEE
ncbi:MAG: DUF4468 domain-containing protein [Bacteroidaceae bacterium]|nr:DUF4468 domain-containing protein [Bacteroidaceae bacterium]